MVAVTDEADYLFDRWKALPGADDSAMLLLENLLDAQERVADRGGRLRPGPSRLRHVDRPPEAGNGDAADSHTVRRPTAVAAADVPRQRR